MNRGMSERISKDRKLGKPKKTKENGSEEEEK